jgi:FMN phosphatase YigB (HAD superfamily)/DNA-binding XRE family transcriptional regulator
MDEKGLGMRLQTARREAGFTQQELCQKSGLSYSTLAKIERGAIKSPSIFTIQQIAEALNTTVDVLLGDLKAGGSAKKRSKSGVTFVYFDINGCLVRSTFRAFTAIATETGVSSDLVESTYWHYNARVCRGDMSLEDFNQAMAKALGLEDFNWQPYYMDTLEVVKEAAEAAQWASKYYQVGLLSNIMPGFIEEMFANGSLPDIKFDAIVDSSDVKAIKPEAPIYEIATKKAGCKPEEILLIDDSRTNLMAAEKQGWHVLWFSDYSADESAERIRSALEF